MYIYCLFKKVLYQILILFMVFINGRDINFITRHYIPFQYTLKLMLVLLCCMHIFNRILSLNFLSTPKVVCQASFLLLVRARCEHHFQISYSILSWWRLEISNGRNVYTMEIVKCSKSGFFFFSQMVNF